MENEDWEVYGVDGSLDVQGEPNPMDTVIFAGNPTPGRAVVHVKLKLKADVRKAAGKHGAAITTTGSEPAEVKIELTLWTGTQISQYRELLLKLGLLRKGRRKPEPVDVYHPLLDDRGIDSLVVTGETCSRKSGKDPWVAVLDCLEYVPDTASAAGVNTPKASLDITKLGPGAVGKKLAASAPAVQPPSTSQSGPNEPPLFLRRPPP